MREGETRGPGEMIEGANGRMGETDRRRKHLFVRSGRRISKHVSKSLHRVFASPIRISLHAFTVAFRSSLFQPTATPFRDAMNDLMAT